MKKVFYAAAISAAMLSTCFTMTTLTSCTDEDDSLTIDEFVNFTACTVKANAAGDKVTISGTLSANSKFKNLQILRADGTEYANLLDADTQLKEKGDDGKTFTITLPATIVSVADASNLTLYCKLRGETEKSLKLGETFTFTIGIPDCKTVGSYVSFINNAVYMMTDCTTGSSAGYNITEKGKKVECIAQNDYTLIPASKSTGAFKGLAQCQAYVNGGVIATSTGCVISSTITQNPASQTFTLNGTKVGGNDIIKVDNSAMTLTK